MPQGPPAEAPRQQLSHPTMQLPPNTILVPNVFYNSTVVFNLCWRNKYELHVWTMDVYSSHSDQYDATSRLSRVTKGDMIA